MPIDRGMIDQLRHLLRPITISVANTIARGVIQLVDDSKKMQLVQLGVLDGETVDGAEHLQSYGLSSVPFPGAEAAIVFPNGDRSHPLVVAVPDRRYRPTGGQAGEVVLYTDEGDAIRLGRGHVISLATSGQVRLGSASATEGAIKGTARNTAEQTFLTALSTFVTAIVDTTGAPSGAKATFIAAITAFASAAGAAVSTKVKLE